MFVAGVPEISRDLKIKQTLRWLLLLLLRDRCFCLRGDREAVPGDLPPEGPIWFWEVIGSSASP